MFFIDDRFYGTITAHVDGPQAAQYRFTSALPAQLFKSLAPVMQPLVERTIAHGHVPLSDVGTDGTQVQVGQAQAQRTTLCCGMRDRKSVVEGKRVSVRLDFGAGRYLKKKKK